MDLKAGVLLNTESLTHRCRRFSSMEATVLSLQKTHQDIVSVHTDEVAARQIGDYCERGLSRPEDDD